MDTTLVCADGTRLAATVLPGDNGGCIVINPAMGVRRQFYAPLAEALNGAGYSTITFDYRGVAGSAPVDLRRCRARLYEWGECDIEAALRHARDERHEKTGVIGHSVGSQLLGMAESSAAIDAIVMVASSSAYWGHWHGLPRIGLLAVWYGVIPVVTRLFGRFPAALAGGNVDLPPLIARDWARCGRDPDYVRGRYARASDRNYARVRAPILAVSVSDDGYAPRAATEALLQWYAAAAERTLIDLTPASLGVDRVGHFGWFRSPIGQSVWPETIAWLDEKLAIRREPTPQ